MLELVMILILVVFSALNLVLLGYLVRFFVGAANQVQNFILPVDENTPSPLTQIVDRAGHEAGHAAAIEAKTTLMGKASGEARLEQAIAADVTQDSLAGNNPMIGELLNMFPTLKKRAIKNPGVLDYLLNRLGSAGVRTPGVDHGSSNFAEQLARYKGG